MNSGGIMRADEPAGVGRGSVGHVWEFYLHYRRKKGIIREFSQGIA